MEMQKQVKHPLWAEFWHQWEKSWGDSEGVPLGAWPLAWWGYTRGHEKATRSRPELVPNQN